MAPALVKLLRVLLFKWRDLPPLQSPTFDWVYHATGLAIGHLVNVTDLGRVWVEEALDAGLIEAVLKANPVYCVYEEVVRSGIERRHTINHLLGNLFLSIIRYLMWPSVTRRVLRWSKKAQKSSSENAAHDKSQEGRMDLWAYWKRVEHQARTFNNVMAELKARQCICSNAECPLRGESLPTSTVKLRDVKYSRCCGCLTALYCSHYCQKADWKPRHREECKIWARKQRAGSRAVSYAEECFLLQLMDLYLDLDHNRFTFYQAARSYIRSPVEDQENSPLIAFFDFNADFSPRRSDLRYGHKWGPECLQVMEIGQLLSMMPNQRERVMKLSLEKGGNLSQNQCLAIAIFPDGEDRFLAAKPLKYRD
ncbi:hypothetical protein V5O48_013334 [Marasmius crinis-equi]|uniref:MYND-type domain-containing protein n=1 Tax=Marasmius crinis-equi TaxID=585013 RepID=A0ABR3F0C5_9AGAR